MNKTAAFAKKALKYIFLMCVCVLLSVPAATLRAGAGLAPGTIAPMSTLWYTAGGATAEELPFVFDDTMTENARIVTQNGISDVTNPRFTFLELDLTLNVADIPADKRFGFTYGLASFRAQTGSDDTAMLYFTQNGQEIACGFSTYADGLENTAVRPVPVGTAGSEITVRFTVGAAGNVSLAQKAGDVYADVADFQSADANAVYGGCLGFVQTGVCSVSVTDFSVTYYENIRPDNSNALETFSHNNFNADLWTSAATNPGGFPLRQVIENDAFLFENTQGSYFATRSSYSNVALEMEIPYVQRTPVYDENGALIKTTSNSIIAALCAPSPSTSVSQAGYAVELAPAGGTAESPATRTLLKVFAAGTEVFRYTMPERYNMFSPAAEGKTFGLSVRLVDGAISVYFKENSEKGFTKIAEYYTEPTNATGCVSIFNGWSSIPDWRGNFSIDNVAVYSLDVNAVAADKISLAPEKIPLKPEDFPYEDTWDKDDLPFDGAI